MTGFTFSAEQVRSAPPEVRRWIEGEIVRALRGPLNDDTSKAQANGLNACSFEEVVQIFNLISSNFIVAQVFFELGRETPFTHNIPQLHALDFGDIIRHTQLSDAARVIDCLNAINQALQTVRGDPEASLFLSDEAGHVFVHDTTSRNFRKLRDQLILAQAEQGQGLTAGHGGAPLVKPAASALPLESGEMQPEHAFSQPPGA
jgi:hypothetical protein